MSLTYTKAIDEMVRLLAVQWNALTPALLQRPEPALLQYPGMPQGNPDVEQPFGRLLIRHVSDPRHTFGPPGSRRYTRSGFITIQCFGPIDDVNWPAGGLSLAENLAIIARDAYEGVGTNDGLWFRNAHVIEIGADKVYYEQRARIDFTYDECK
ncbi:hypothetical protein CPT_Sonora_017 [Stenotrophomonas phage Sonora]|nr:hypothetical protein CPT_Sonora_017 [Stenotrophomonas phage Sonora]